MIGIILISAAAAALPQPAVDEIVLTATRIPRDGDLYPVQAIPEERLIARDSVADALSEIADVYVQAPSGRAGVSAVFLRGADPNFTAVLLDGVPLNNPANILGGAVSVAEIASAGFERIEVATGPLSSLYGSGALAGVINLVIPGGSPEHALETRIAVGTAGDYSGFARWRGSVAASYGGSLALNYDDAGDMAEPSRFRSTSVLGKLASLGSPDTSRIVFRAANTSSKSFPEASGGERLAVIRDLEDRESSELLLGASQRLFDGERVQFDLLGSFLKRRDRTVGPGVAGTDADPIGVPGGNDLTRYRRASGQGIARYSSGDWQAVAGVEVQHETARSTGALSLFGMTLPTGFRGDRWTRSGFVEASRTTSDWLINGAVRLDKIDGLGARATARAGLLYTLPGTRLSFRAAAGTGFKAPSFYALGNPFVGNPALAPERSRSIEAGAGWVDAENASVALTTFYNRYLGLIDFVPEPVPRLENRGVVTAKGVSLTAKKSFTNAFDASVNALYVDTRDRESGERLLNRPRWRVGATINAKLADDLTIGGRYSFVGGRRAFSVPTGIVDLSRYHALSFEGAWAVREGPTLRVIVDNALDGKYEDAVGFETPGRRARLVLGYQF